MLMLDVASFADQPCFDERNSLQNAAVTSGQESIDLARVLRRQHMAGFALEGVKGNNISSTKDEHQMTKMKHSISGGLTRSSLQKEPV